MFHPSPKKKKGGGGQKEKSQGLHTLLESPHCPGLSRAQNGINLTKDTLCRGQKKAPSSTITFSFFIFRKWQRFCKHWLVKPVASQAGLGFIDQLSRMERQPGKLWMATQIWLRERKPLFFLNVFSFSLPPPPVPRLNKTALFPEWIQKD